MEQEIHANTKYDSIYDVTYDFNDRTLQVYDTLNDMYAFLEPTQFEALLTAHFVDSVRADAIRRLLYSGTKLKVSFHTQQAAVAPPPTYDFSNMVMRTMFEVKNTKFKSKEQQRDYFLAQYGMIVH